MYKKLSSSDPEKMWLHQKTQNFGDQNPNWRGGKEVPCDQCGTLVWRRPSELRKHKHHFCSSKCHDDFRRKPKNTISRSELRGYKHGRWNGIIKYCKTCKAELIGRDRRKRGYCSDKCAETGKKNRKVLRGADHPDWKGGKVTLQCEWCGDDFAVSPSKKKTAHYCSPKCRALGRRNRVTLTCEQCGKKFIVAYVRFRDLNPRFCSLRCYRKFSGKTTLELEVAKALESLRIEFIDEYRPKGTRRVFDFYLPESKTFIEADGDFWHHSDWAIQNGARRRDRAKNKWVKEHGFKLIRLREDDVKLHGALSLLQSALIEEGVCHPVQEALPLNK